ncbi:MAG: hypothetical protein ONB44_02160 [candidate division KSB1 bacterium]|nr:hypothetical protein [candidate division KSB1 bacterium]
MKLTKMSAASNRHARILSLAVFIITWLLSFSFANAVFGKKVSWFDKTLFHRAMRFNVNVEPICFSPEEFAEEQLPIIRDIKQSGGGDYRFE